MGKRCGTGPNNPPRCMGSAAMGSENCTCVMKSSKPRPTREEFDALVKRVEEMEKRVEEMEKRRR